MIVKVTRMASRILGLSLAYSMHCCKGPRMVVRVLGWLQRAYGIAAGILGLVFDPLHAYLSPSYLQWHHQHALHDPHHSPSYLQWHHQHALHDPHLSPSYLRWHHQHALHDPQSGYQHTNSEATQNEEPQ